MQKYRVTIIMSTSRLSFFFFYAILVILVNPTINAQRDPYVLHECSTTGNVTSNSTFRANLNTLISTLSSNTQIDYGFYNFTEGEGTNKVYATGLCRADLSPTDCRSGVNMSAHDRALTVVSNTERGCHVVHELYSSILKQLDIWCYGNYTYSTWFCFFFFLIFFEKSDSS